MRKRYFLRGARYAPAVAVLACILVPSPAASAAPSSACRTTFRVQHDDHIGRLQLPAGPYRTRVSGGLSCAAASQLLAAFLQDFDGVLRRPWRYNVRGTGSGLFYSAPSGQPAFSVQRAGRARGGGGQNAVLDCRGTYQVLNDDRIGALSLSAGAYRITRLSPLSPTCSQSAQLLTRFLDQPSGILPAGWIVLADDGAFVNGSVSYGFRVKSAV